MIDKITEGYVVQVFESEARDTASSRKYVSSSIVVPDPDLEATLWEQDGQR